MELRLAVPADFVARTGFLLDSGPFVALPDEPRRWMESIVGTSLPAGLRAGAIAGVEIKNDLGWPMEACRVDVVDAEDKVVEVRLAAFYKFNEWVAYVICRGPADRVEGAREEILKVFASGRPRWQTATVVAAIVELWS